MRPPVANGKPLASTPEGLALMNQSIALINGARNAHRVLPLNFFSPVTQLTPGEPRPIPSTNNAARLQALPVAAGLHFSAGPRKCCGIEVAKPSTIWTGLATILTWADFRPGRLAVTVIVPAEKVERTKTRLIPHSVFR